MSLVLNLQKNAALADELGALERELKPYRHKIARAEALRKAIRHEFAATPAASEHVVTGERFEVYVGACGNETLIEKPKLLTRISLEQYVAITAPTLRAVSENCGAHILALCTQIVQTGPRALSVIERVTPTPAEAAAVAPAKKPTKARGKKAA